MHSWSEFHQLIESVTKWHDYREFVTARSIVQWTLDHILFFDFILLFFHVLVFLLLLFMFDYFWMSICSVMAFYQLRVLVSVFVLINDYL